MKLYRNLPYLICNLSIICRAKQIKSLRGRDKNSEKDITLINSEIRNLNEDHCEVSQAHWIGDGYCDISGGYNTEACNWDGGDCCANTCTSTNQYQCGVWTAYECLDPGSKCNVDEGETWCETLQSCVKKWITQCPTACSSDDQCRTITGGCGGFSCQCVSIGIDQSWGSEDQCPPHFCACAGCSGDPCTNSKAVCLNEGYCGLKIHETVTETPSMVHIPNTYCQYYSQGGDGTCNDGVSFQHAWQLCNEDGPDQCMGIMWNSCEGETSNTSVNGAWKLIRAGQSIGDADNPTSTCGGSAQALGHWDVFIRATETPSMVHIPNTYCQYYSQGGDGTCNDGISFQHAWQLCDEDGPDQCMGIMWNSCEGETSNTSVNGAWKLIRAGQSIGDADNPTSTCGGSAQALGHWDVFIRATP
eukprot:CAMPEP_0113315920 /NCGR_PEP_ID=MMETSP0010_2-20120614/11395_1 /TAXON_ID=216773 ORGANISM="Corethron hystrix, Strain 308" /NCGR_SAMPLE_ID=MMETSP0010_2 /ASSEMBLY_ACC=CAM_ASM_000155 /LENGTH=415 /DNA_ID=CAMNT_0000172517 /DNA_START=110 /DNA_END=1357 /DNA_ORIENTATION=+ /assembly_acc=CAM_ASM_000155